VWKQYVVGAILASLCLSAGVQGAEHLNEATEKALTTESYIYVATRRANGAWSEPAPIWFSYEGGAIYFTTAPTSHKARRIRHGSSVRIWIGRKDGPLVEGEAQVVNDLDIVERMSAAYSQKYWIAWLGFFRPRPGRVAAGKTLAVKVTLTPLTKQP
jgi:PPOX class probable F420-dependent enzyme